MVRRPAVERAYVVEGAFAPALTPWDVRVLKACAPYVEGAEWTRGGVWFSTWRIAEEIDSDDVKAVRETLFGLFRTSGLVYGIGMSDPRRVRWMRSAVGEEYLRG